MNDLFVLLGRPVEHSLSPVLYRAAFRACGRDARYVALHARAFEPAWAAVRRLEVRGGNVTVPWKERAARALDRPSGKALRARAANTFWREDDGALAGTETDGEGFLRGFAEAFAADLSGLRAAVLGAGGAARAVLHALADAGTPALFVWSRRPEASAALARELRARGVVAHGVGEAGGGPQAIDVLVNATPASLAGEMPAGDPLALFSGPTFAVDLAYARAPTPFLAAMRAVGVAAVDGRGMLLHQAALAFERWFGETAPTDAMRRALERALGAG